METKSPLKSLTINGNIFATAVLMLLPHFGITVTPEVTALAMGIGNILLRFITKKPISFTSMDRKIDLLYKGYEELKKDIQDMKKNEK